jgi:hypothetical protein
MQLLFLWISLKQKTVSILLTENNIGFYNVMISALFNCMRIVWHFTCFVWYLVDFTVLHILLL